MSENKGSNQHEIISTGLREDLIQTAVRFLTHPNVTPRPLEQKKGFLISKGLTENEMQEAINRSLAKAPLPAPVPIHPSQYLLSPDIGPFEKLRRILHTLLLLGGLGYGIYWVYKTYIEPWLFGKKGPRSKPVEERVTDLEETVRKSIAEIQVELGELGKSTSAANRAQDKFATFDQVKGLQSDVASVKSLLLNRQQFPPVPAVTPLKSTITIPAWQLSEPTTNAADANKEPAAVSNGKDSSELSADFADAESQHALVSHGEDSS